MLVQLVSPLHTHAAADQSGHTATLSTNAAAAKSSGAALVLVVAVWLGLLGSENPGKGCDSLLDLCVAGL